MVPTGRLACSFWVQGLGVAFSLLARKDTPALQGNFEATVESSLLVEENIVFSPGWGGEAEQDFAGSFEGMCEF